MSEEQSDEQLVLRAQKGDKRAFELLVRQKYRVQYKIIQHSFGDDMDGPA
ncbi:MAG: hypothetical protein ACRETW_13730 [Stenotrophobium sp.]